MTTPSTTAARWLDKPGHHRWLAAEEDRLVDFHTRTAHGARVGFSPLGLDGRPDDKADRELWLTCRMIHCFSIEHLLGRPGSASIAAHGVQTLQRYFHDLKNGGWYAAVGADGEPTSQTKSGYGHAFVILAGASATQAGIEGGHELLTDALDVIDDHFWIENDQAVVDALTDNWTVIEPGYRGQNANMHLTEAYMAAAEATGDLTLLDRAREIAERIVNKDARNLHWRLPEHYDQDWNVVPEYNQDKPADPFRPYGTLVGHWFEWARIVLQLDHLLDGSLDWAQEAATQLFATGVAEGWDPAAGGVAYSLDVEGNPVNTDRMHWVMAEAIGAAVALARRTGEPAYDQWYQCFWDYVARSVIDPSGGSWWHELDRDGQPKFETWATKPDLYHALQATLYARSRFGPGLAAAARAAQE